VYHHRSVSLGNEKICCEISADKKTVCEKITVLWRGNFSELNSSVFESVSSCNNISDSLRAGPREE
jgi:hypothetical protein